MNRLSASLIAVVALSVGGTTNAIAQSGAVNPAPDAGVHFRFVILADPQLGAQNNTAPVSKNAQETTALAASELNAMNPRPVFAFWAGDLVNVFEPRSVANFKRLTELFEMPNLLMHGNHDTVPPYDGYLELQKEISGVESPFYSFDVGSWHFVVTPCNLMGTTKAAVAAEEAMLKWLEADLEATKKKPTVFFNHLHFMPQGLTQTEWYMHPLELRKKMLDLMCRHGNVKYYFNGHVHNGIKTAEKVAWEYRGIKFFTVPTLIQPRPYGEEYPQFKTGIERGGYYLVVDVDDDTLTLRGRLAGSAEEYVFPASAFKPFREQEHPLWFQRLVDLSASDRLHNGDFQSGFAQWSLPNRYKRDENPFFLATTDAEGVRLAVETPAESIWANDEYQQVSQIVKIAPGESPVISGRYLLPSVPEAGGGYISALLMSDTEFKGLMMFRWSSTESQSDYLPRSFGYQVRGRQTSPLYFQDLAKTKKGMFLKLPDSPQVWHSFNFNLGRLYDKAHNDGAFARLGVTKMHFAVGVWNQNNLAGMRSEARFADLGLKSDGSDSLLDNAPVVVDESVFSCQFGQMVTEKNHKDSGKH
ncbi:MAG: metallophosphoesterase [Planctomycetia bacterium]